MLAVERPSGSDAVERFEQDPTLELEQANFDAGPRVRKSRPPRAQVNELAGDVMSTDEHTKASIGWRSYLGMSLVCCATLLTEIVLTRYFSFSIWYHFAYLAISVALLGYGAAGSFYYAWPSLTRRGVDHVLARISLGAAVGLVVSLLLAARVPFDPFKLFVQGRPSWDADLWQLLYLAVLCVVITVPFFLAGLVVTILLSHGGTRVGKLYFADLFGAGVGCALAVYLLTPLGVPGVILLSSVLLALASTLWSSSNQGMRRLALLWCVFVIALAKPLAQWSEARPGSNKFLARLLTNPDTRRLYSAWSPVYRVDVLGSGRSDRPWRMGRAAAWGISPKFDGTPPENVVITHDGDASTMMYRYDGNPDTMRILDYSILRFPYLLLEEPSVLIVGVGGGVDVHAARRFGARKITGVELNPVTVRVLLELFADFNGGIFRAPGVTIYTDEGRNFIRRSQEQFDLIEFTGIDTLAAVYSGAYVLAESYLYTKEALREYWERLAPGGTISFVRGDWGFGDRPPIQLMRLVNVALETLADAGVADPRSHLFVVSSGRQAGNPGPPIFNLQIRKTPLRSEQVDRLLRHAEEFRYEVWYAPDGPRDNPIANLVQPDPVRRAALMEALPFNLAATTDDRPFFFNFFKWSRLWVGATQRSDYTFASGQLILLAILVQVAILAGASIILPLLRLPASNLSIQAWPYLAYFSALGLGFILVEISYVQRFTLFLGSPVYSLAVIIASMLVFAGLGSFLTTPLLARVTWNRAIAGLFVGLVVINLAYAVFLPVFFQAFLGQSLAIRVAATVVSLAPLAALMGTFLPIGLRVLHETEPRLIPWAWAVNGVTSVVGAILCIVLAMMMGFRAVNLLALVIYAAGVAALVLAGLPQVAEASQRDAAGVST